MKKYIKKHWKSVTFCSHG